MHGPVIRLFNNSKHITASPLRPNWTLPICMTSSIISSRQTRNHTHAWTANSVKTRIQNTLQQSAPLHPNLTLPICITGNQSRMQIAVMCFWIFKQSDYRIICPYMMSTHLKLRQQWLVEMTIAFLQYIYIIWSKDSQIICPYMMYTTGRFMGANAPPFGGQ